MSKPGVTAAAFALIMSTMSGVAILLAIVPWPLAFGVALAAATAWCLWLERHPT